MKHHEDDEQRALFQWAGYRKDLKWMHAIPNGGNRNRNEAARMIGQGTKKGVFDVFLPLPVYRPGVNGFHAGLYIEMKRRKDQGSSRISPEQVEFAADMTDVGYKCVVCYGFEEARQAIKDYTGK